MAPRRKCPVCGSRQWHKEPSSGLIACSEGHVLQNYRTESGDAEDLGNHSMMKRTLKSGRKKKESESKADPKLYHGARARFHYFQCLQLLLRKQIMALIALWELPTEFEVVCRDIWALHLELLPRPLIAEPYLHLHESQNKDMTSKKPRERRQETDGSTTEFAVASKGLGSSEQKLLGDSDSEQDSDMDDLLRENSETSSSDEGDEDGKAKASQHSLHTPSQQNPSKLDRPASNIAVLMVACWTLRIPVTYMDFIKLIESYKLPYLESAASLPQSMTLHLTKHTIKSLSPNHAPSTASLHYLSSRLAKLMQINFGISTPELNTAPMLWRVVRSLGGTPVLYNFTKKLGRVLSLPLTLHPTLAPALEQIRKSDPEKHKFDNVPPEVALIAAVVVVLKLIYGLDGKMRVPEDVSEPAYALPQLNEYLMTLQERTSSDANVKENMFSSRKPMPIGDLDDATLDDYLKFCERALIGRQDGHSEERVLDSYFPLSSENSEEGEQSADAVAASAPAASATRRLPMSTVQGDAHTSLRPGEAYTIWNSRDVLGDLPGEYETVLERSAEWVGVDRGYLCGVVETYERRIGRWWDGERRREREERRNGSNGS